MRTLYKGALEVDVERGVVYFHDDKGGCLLRVDGLENPNPDYAQIDIRIRRGLDAPTNIPRKDLCGKVVIAEIVVDNIKDAIARHKEEIKSGSCCATHKSTKR